MRAWTTFAVGTSPREGRTLQPLPGTIKGISTLDVPDGANPSKIATWVQRLATEGGLADECPVELHDAVQLGSLSLTSDPSQALAIDMTGNPVGDKMLQRLTGVEGEKAWLLFGLTDAEQPD